MPKITICLKLQQQKNGVDLGQNQVKLLQKVEELTLYMIEKDKQLNEQKIVVADLENKNNQQSMVSKQLSDQVELQKEQITSQQAQLKSQQEQLNPLIKQVSILSQKSK